MAAIANNLAVEQVESEFTHSEAAGFGGMSSAANEGLNAREQFRKGKRFDEVIVAAGLEAFHTVVHGRSGAEDQDREEHFFATQSLDKAEAIEFGQHDVDHGSVIRDRTSHRQGLLSVGTMVHRETALLQPLQDEGSDLFIIFHHQNSHSVLDQHRVPWEKVKRGCDRIHSTIA